MHGDELWSLRKINYSERINQNGITIHSINGMEFSSMDTEKDPSDRTFTEKSLNNDPDDYSKGRSLENLKKNPQYMEFLKKADVKAFESLEECNEFHFELMQAVADKLFYKKIHIDMDFVDDPQNDFVIETILA